MEVKMKTILILLSFITTNLSYAETTVQNVDETVAETEHIFTPAQFYCQETDDGFAIYKDRLGPINSKLGSFSGKEALENFNLCKKNIRIARMYDGNVSVDLASGRTKAQLTNANWELKSFVEGARYGNTSVCETPVNTCLAFRMPSGSPCVCNTESRGFSRGVQRNIYSDVNGKVEVY
jgi:hypothetical protein